MAWASGAGVAPSPSRTTTTAAPSRPKSAKPPGQGVVLVTDMFGGSPSNLSLPACATQGRRILYGANLPMLIKLAKSRDLAVSEAVAAALDAGRKYINSLDLGGGA